MIFDKRLSEWAEQHGLRAKGQAGFHKDYRITDQLFILQTLIEQSKAKKKALYFMLCGLQKGVRYYVAWSAMAGVG